MTAQRLATTVTGSGPRLTFVHGFTQTARSWAPIAAAFAPDHQVVCVDAPGHGGSARVDTDLTVGADVLAATAGRGTYIGYSMGARLCLHVALTRPAAVDRLVLVSATAGIEDPRHRAARRASDDALAAQIEAMGVERFVDRWLALPLFATLADEAAGRAERLTNTVAGLASSLRRAGTGTQEPLWDRLARLTMPVLVVTGSLDTKFTALGRRLAASVPGSTLRVVEGAGHTVHLEQPAVFVEIVRSWLATSQLPSASPIDASNP